LPALGSATRSARFTRGDAGAWPRHERECLRPGRQPLVAEEGELVCTAPFPSMPLRFWNDPNDQRYKSTYFDTYPNVWRHGDFARITDNGGLIVSGRSDATLKPGGVRIGTAEIYRQVETVAEVQDSVVVGQEWEGDVRIILFVNWPPARGSTKSWFRSCVPSSGTTRHPATSRPGSYPWPTSPTR